ncbi:DUF1707 SHOCT-like domain-containing protein [Amycolatopsis rubida]|uniref:DUF1707 domain-containing protein n=1 Tax=Amycolatopsis rubida TaxID=112413 RepID=A0A1I5XY45_9PSEU|nr:DUF1707 domain-containing protein [Amycolatopsis rubida]SFQ36902.1 protein of unknown function [Amycolatopsis rubida]
MADLRLSDAERQDALDVLSEHVRTGRLDIDEYGSRSAKVTSAKLVSELVPLFDDLPSPRPSALLATARPEPVVPAGTGKLGAFVWRYSVPLSIALAVVVLIVTRGRLLIVFALPLLLILFSGWRRR